ncbi:MAG: tail fiber domain-containing protein [Bacteroidota bacterium]
MRKFITLLLLCFTINSYGQNVGIGTDVPTHSLHIIAEANPVRLQGLQTGNATDSVVTIDATGVLRMRSSAFTLSLTGWSTTGNSNTTASNFLGTTDGKALLLRTNNQPSGFIDPLAATRNNAYGNRSLAVVTTGSGNNAVGYVALTALTFGNGNTALGDSAAYNITIGSDNIALGSRTLVAAATAINNIAIGSNALRNNLTSENIAIGKDAATANIAGANILAIGTMALQKNTSTNTELAIGNNALKSLNGGQENIAVGYNAGLNITSSNYNVLLGHFTLSSTTGSSRNTIIGHNAAIAYSAGGNGDNVFIGYQTALSQTGGLGNTYVGAAIDVAGNFSPGNSSALGQSVVITASNQVRIGNTNVSSIGGQVSWTTFSDARIKKNIREDVPGLSFIEQLKPVTYNYDLQSMKKLQGGKGLTDNSGFENIRFTGLLAQDVEAAAKKIGYVFSGVDKPTNAYTPYGLRYSELVVPMIKAMQEMKALIDKQQKEIDELKASIKK